MPAPPSRGRLARASAAAALALLLAACNRTPRDPFLTYFNGEHGISLRHPASWKGEEAQQEGVWYRYFLGPASGPQRKPEVSVTLSAASLGGSLEDYAQTYLAGHALATARDEARPGAQARAYRFASADGRTRYSLLLLQEAGRVYGLYSQGETSLFEKHLATVEEMEKSLTLERPSTYPEDRDEAAGYALRVPPSWKETREFSGGDTLLKQFTSPAIGFERRQTLHASLTLTVEKAPGDGSAEAFARALTAKLGDAYQTLSHGKWKDGFVEVQRTETPVATARVRRYVRVVGGRAYSLSCDVREDLSSRVSRWCDIIAMTLQTRGEMTRP